MTGRRGQARHRRTPVVLLFGENLNDSESIRHLLAHASPELARRLRARPRPMSLTHGAGRDAVRRWIDELSGVVRSMERAGTPVQAVVVHRDADGPDPSGTRHSQLATQLNALGCDAFAVVPVQMTEAWWFLFPDAVEAVRPQAWRRRMPRSNRDVETIDNPKAELQRVTRPSGHEYSEADSPAIAQKVSDLAAVPHGRSASYERLRKTASILTR